MLHYPEFEKVAVIIVSLLPKMNPRKYNVKNVNVGYSWPIFF